jgi:hypothetical protein
MMSDPVTIEIIGFEDSFCGPFPCDENRTCGLEKCAPSENLVQAYEALEEALSAQYGNRITLRLTLLDETIPDYVKEIVEEHHPPIPIVLVNGQVTPIGRVSLPLVQKELEKYL